MAEVGGVSAEGGLAVEDLAVATGGPVGGGVVREAFLKGIAAVVDAD